MSTLVGSAKTALAVLLLALAPVAIAEEGDGLPSVESHLSGATRITGYLDMAWQPSTGKLLFLLDAEALERDWLYQEALATGVGSNDIGLDRGQLGLTALIRFERYGPKVLVVQPNLYYRANTNNAAERRAVADAFAQSVLASLPVVAEDEQFVAVDATAWLVADTHGIVQRLKQTGQGDFSLDGARSTILPDAVLGFPSNSEIEVLLTFQTAQAGDWVQQVTPTATSVSVRTHHSFIELPGPGYEPRRFHPNSGYFPIGYRDYGAALGAPLDQLFIPRHRLIKANPEAALSPAVEPIVYYLDPGTPEPVRSALLDGARWWNQAFEAAGFQDAFQVEMLPEGAHPLDVRYNVIQWVHRSTRGWSYGSSVRDPRTGEIIKGHITLGSLRVRQDMAIASGLLAPFDDSPDAAQKAAAVEQLALARLRQLSAHEVGHTLGLAHNFAGSNDNRASVMDYPHPLLRLMGSELSVEDAYATGIGEWDKFAITYGYGEFAEPDNKALDQMMRRFPDSGFHFVADQNARGPDAVHAQAHLWDNGGDPTAELLELQRIRGLALDRFSEDVLRPGAPLSEMETVLVPVYLLHRYQLEAAAKQLGGLRFRHALKGQGSSELERVPAADQRAALVAITAALAPENLTLPAHVLDQIPPPAYGYTRDRENFAHRTGDAFDAVAPAEALAQWISRRLLSPIRTARIARQHALDRSQVSVNEVIDALLDQTLGQRSTGGYATAASNAAGWVIVNDLLRLFASSEAAPAVKADAYDALRQLQRRSGRQGGFGALVAQHIARQLDRAVEAAPAPPVKVPPGSPIGTH